MGTCCRNIVAGCYSVRIFTFDGDYLWRCGNVDVKPVHLAIEGRPPCSSRYNNVGIENFLLRLNHRDGDWRRVVLFVYVCCEKSITWTIAGQSVSKASLSHLL